MLLGALARGELGAKACNVRKPQSACKVNLSSEIRRLPFVISVTIVVRCL